MFESFLKERLPPSRKLSKIPLVNRMILSQLNAQKTLHEFKSLIIFQPFLWNKKLTCKNFS